jgi:YD repeat-containing protein
MRPPPLVYLLVVLPAGLSAAGNNAPPAAPEPPPELRAFTGHVDTVQRLALSPDGSRLATSGGDGTVRLWDTRRGLPIRTIDSVTDEIGGPLLFSPDSAAFAIFLPEVGVEVRSAGSGSLIRLISEIEQAVFSPDGRTLLTWDRSGTLTAWNWRTGERLFTRERPLDLRRPYYSLYAAAFSPDGRSIALSVKDPEDRRYYVELRDESLKEQSGRFQLQDAALALAFSPDGRSLAAVVASPDTSVVELWGLHPLRKQRSLRLPDFASHQPSAVFSAADDRVLVAGLGRVAACGGGQRTRVRDFLGAAESSWPVCAVSAAGLTAVHAGNGVVRLYRWPPG